MTSFDYRMLDGGAAVVEATGRLNMVSAPELRSAVQAAVAERATLVVVDLTAVKFIDSTGISALVGSLRTTRESGCDLRIAGVAGQVATVLTMTRIDKVLRPYATVAEAVRHR